MMYFDFNLDRHREQLDEFERNSYNFESLDR